MEFIPQLARRLQEEPETVIADLEEVRRYCMCENYTPNQPLLTMLVTDPSGIRFSVTGNVLSLGKPRSTWGKYFETLPVSLYTRSYKVNNVIALKEGPLSPVPLAVAELSEVGKEPVKKVTLE